MDVFGYNLLKCRSERIEGLDFQNTPGGYGGGNKLRGGIAAFRYLKLKRTVVERETGLDSV